MQATMCDVREADYVKRCAVRDWKGSPRGRCNAFGKRSFVMCTSTMGRGRRSSRSRSRRAVPNKAKNSARKDVHYERPERVSRLCSYRLRPSSQEVRERGREVSPHGESRPCDLRELPQFRRLEVTVRDLQSLERFVFENELIRRRQRSSDVLATNSAYEELEVNEVPVHAFHITSRMPRQHTSEVVKPASDLERYGNRQHVCFHAIRDAATAYLASKAGRRTMLCVQLRAAADAGTTVLRTTQVSPGH